MEEKFPRISLLTHMKNVSLCNDQCQAGRPSVRMWQKLQRYNFLGHYTYDNCQTFHDGSIHWALSIHTAFSVLDCISKSQQCETFLSENVLIRLSWNFVQLLITSSRLCMYNYFWFLHRFKGNNWRFLVWKKTKKL